MRKWYTVVLAGVLSLVLGFLTLSTARPASAWGCNGTQSYWEYRTRTETKEEGCVECTIVEKRHWLRRQYEGWNHQCYWGAWTPVDHWIRVSKSCEEVTCGPQETETPPPPPEFTPEPTHVPDPHVGVDFFPNTEQGSVPPADGRIWAVQTDNPVVGEYGIAGIYVENTNCEMPVYAGREVNGFGNVCRLINATGRSGYAGWMYERSDMPGRQFFVPAVNDNVNGWWPFVLPDDANLDNNDNAVELDFASAVEVGPILD